ncbi:MAG TPA: hybrid sensor histidine kinase/response regulator [Actinomycetota bacterium]|nr:hybrid sensor histidine kinase/response regulator [Actinomycetota bacterium]
MPTKVLLCDAPDGLALLQYALLRSGAELEVEAAPDGFRAVELAARLQPEVVVCEIDLEGLAGTELVRRLLASAPGARLVCWTAVASAGSAAEMLGAGAVGYLLKEDGPDGIVRAIRAAASGVGVVLSPKVARLLADRFAESLRRDQELEESLAEATGKLDEVRAAKAEFLANVSHELRTPVTVAKGIAYVLRNRDVPDPEREEFLHQLEASLDKLMGIVDEILTIAELDRGTLALNLQQVDLAPLLRHLAEEAARRYPEHRIDHRVPDPLPAMADPGRISEVVRQLLDNACRYSPPHESVSLQARVLEEGVVVSVTDHGLGMAREVLSRAFEEPFSTGERVLRKERAGVGLGLHMARQLVAQHGGVLWADPLPSGGTRVSFCLPADRGQRVMAPPVLAPEAPRTP